MTAPLPTSGEVRRMRRLHVQTPGDEIQPWPYEWCQYDGQDWPCDAARLLALADSRRYHGPCHCTPPPFGDGPAEDCPQHGRAYTEWVERGDVLQARLAAVLAECDRHRLHGRWECACGDAHLYEADPQHRMDLYALHLADRIRRAAAGEAT